MYCKKCGAKLHDDDLFCSKCGTKVTTSEGSKKYSSKNKHEVNWIDLGPKSNTRLQFEEYMKRMDIDIDWSAGNILEQIRINWLNLSLFMKIATISLLLTLFQLLISLILKSISSVFFDLMTLLFIGYGISLYMEENGNPEAGTGLGKYGLIIIAAVFMYFSINLNTDRLLYNISSHFNPKPETQTPEPSSLVSKIADVSGNLQEEKQKEVQEEVQEEVPVEQSEVYNPLPFENTIVEDKHSLVTDKEYTWLCAENHLYVAKAISKNTVKIEYWYRKSATSRFKLKKDIGSFKINDKSTGFAWIDKDLTTFTMTFDDNAYYKESAGKVFFTINESNSEYNKGTNVEIDNGLKCYSYSIDGDRKYRLIRLTDDLCKIELWRTVGDEYVQSYDVGVIDVTNTTTDFEWIDEKKKSCTVTMKDPRKEDYWKDFESVTYETESKKSKYDTYLSYVNETTLKDNEIKLEYGSSRYSGMDYKNVRDNFESQGFKNIKLVPRYDIIWGITKEGSLASLTVDGKVDFESGTIVTDDVPVVITYHMYESDNPDYIEVPKGSYGYGSQKYKKVVKEFRELGFQSVEAEKYETTDSTQKEGYVSSVKIDGIWSFDKGDRLNPEKRIVVSYYVIVEEKTEGE